MRKKWSLEARKKVSQFWKGKRIGKNNPKWKGGRMLIDCYWYIYSPTHPNKTKAGYVAEHRLIMEKKIGRFLKKSEIIHHLNRIKTDNRIENLVLISSQAEHNHFHPERLIFGESNNLAKLKEKQVIEIRKRLKNGEKNIVLAKEYKVDEETILRIKYRYTWNHLPN